MTNEKEARVLNGALMFFVLTAIEIATGFWFFSVVRESGEESLMVMLPIAVFTLVTILYGGFFSLQPNEARVLILFGKYRGTIKKAGLHWANPLYSNGTPTPTPQEEKFKKAKETGTTIKKTDARYKISLRARTEVGDTIKVNDRKGNPIEIASVVVWKVSDTAKAVFEVDDYRNYVKTQLETSLRHVATQFPYDHSDSGELSEELTLRGNPEEVSNELRVDLSRRLAVAGVVIEDARLTHLAYAPEIAQAMLRRQQADAIISARRKIVQGAVGMVEMALTDLEKSSNIVLDEDKRASMVSNLLVVLCGDRNVQPVVNTGTLYN